MPTLESRHSRLAIAPTVFAALAIAPTLATQCPTWLAAPGTPGVAVTTPGTPPVLEVLEWNPPGAVPSRVAVLGRFDLAGAVATTGAALLNPSVAVGPWSSLTTSAGSFTAADVDSSGNLIYTDGTTIFSTDGFTESVITTTSSLGISDLVVLSNDDIVVGGSGTILGTSIQNVARFDGTSWNAMGSSLTGPQPIVYALVELPSGDIVAGGQFSSSGSTPLSNIARFDGSNWTALGNGTDDAVRALHYDSTNDIVVAGGSFATAGGVTASRLAQWNGTSWSNVTNQTIDGDVLAIVGEVGVAPAGAGSVLTIGGAFLNIGPTNVNHVAQLVLQSTGIRNVLSMENGTDGDVHTITEFGPDITIGGEFSQAGAIAAGNVATFRAVSSSFVWHGIRGPVRLPNTTPNVARAVQSASGELYIAGAFKYTSGGIQHGIARRQGNTIAAPTVGGTAFNEGGIGNAMATVNDQLVVGGEFSSIDGVAANNVAILTPTGWAAFGSGTNGPVHTIAADNFSARVAVAGDFSTAGGITVPGFAIYNTETNTWSSPGAPGSQTPRAIAFVEATGAILAGGSSYLQTFDGISWSDFQGASPNAEVSAITVFGQDDVFVGGGFNTIGGVSTQGMARFNLGSWASLGEGLVSPSIDKIVGLTNGDIVAVGSFEFAGPFSSGTPVQVNRIARFDGTSWSAFGSGTNASVLDAAFVPPGDLFIVGDFTSTNGAPAGHFGQLGSICQAAVAPVGAGCVGSNPPIAGMLSANSGDQPNEGTLFTSSSPLFGTPTQIGVMMVGDTPTNMPLSVAMPSLPGCSLLVDPTGTFVLEAVIANSVGTFTHSFTVPLLPSATGANLFLQLASLQDVGGVLTAASTNRLDLTIGGF